MREALLFAANIPGIIFCNIPVINICFITVKKRSGKYSMTQRGSILWRGGYNETKRKQTVKSIPVCNQRINWQRAEKKILQKQAGGDLVNLKSAS